MRILDQTLASLGIGSLGRNAVLATWGLGIRALIQAVYLIALSRMLGAEGYGIFAGTVAAAVVLSPLAGWGTSFLYAQQVSRDPDRASAMWAGVVVQVLLSGALLVLVFLVAASWLDTRLFWPAMLAVGLAELVALPVALAAGRALMVGNHGGRAALALLLVPAGRLACLVVLLTLGPTATPVLVAFAHLVGSLVGGLAAYRLLTRHVAPAAWSERPALGPQWRQGTPYALAAGAGTSYPEVDKPLILQMLGAAAAGLYSSAFRVVGLFTLPVAALVAATTPRLFAAPDAAARDYIMRRVTLTAGAYSLVAMAACLAIAPLLPWVFGVDFAGASAYVRWLSAWLPLYALHQCAGLRLTCGGGQPLRAGIEAGGLAIVVILNLLLLPTMGPRGAISSLLVAEAFMVAGCVVAASGCRRFFSRKADNDFHDWR